MPITFGGSEIIPLFMLARITYAHSFYLPFFRNYAANETYGFSIDYESNLNEMKIVADYLTFTNAFPNWNVNSQNDDQKSPTSMSIVMNKYSVFVASAVNMGLLNVKDLEPLGILKESEDDFFDDDDDDDDDDGANYATSLSALQLSPTLCLFLGR